MKQVVNINGNFHEVTDNKASFIKADAATECNGNACGVVTVTWTGNGYRIQNNGGKRVRVRIRFTFGLQCLDWANIDLDPGQHQDFGNGAYCNPIEANYI